MDLIAHWKLWNKRQLTIERVKYELEEVWKPIEGYDGLYDVSNMGMVRSHVAGRWHTDMIRKPVKDKDGYMTISLKKNGKYKCFKVHRLVANAFVPNTDGLPQINHKDENKANNRVDNLEWCTPQYNNTYNNKHKAYCKAVIQMDDYGNIIAKYESIGEAAKAVGVCGSCISTVLAGKRKRTGGFRWVFQ